MPNLIIRDFTIDDYSNVTALWERVNLPYRPEGRDSRENVARQITESTTVYLVAESDGKILGTLFGTHDGRKGWINRLAVDIGFQRRNIAKKLVVELENRLEKLGLEVFACVIDSDNATSQEVFRKLGYDYYDVSYYSKRKNPFS